MMGKCCVMGECGVLVEGEGEALATHSGHT